MNVSQKFVSGLIIFFAFSLQSVFGQLQNNNQFSRNNETGINETYFLDQAGFQLANLPFSLDEFVDPDKYLLGPYDVLSIYGKGVIEFNYRGITVNASGDIALPMVGMVSVKNLSLSEASIKIKKAFQENIKNAQVSVSLDQPRPVTLHLAGGVPNPGTYTVQPGMRYSTLISGIAIEGEIFYPMQTGGTISADLTPSNRQTITGLNFEQIEAKSSNQNELSESQFLKLEKKYDLRRVKVTNINDSTYYVDLKAYFTSGNKKFNPYISDGDQINFIERTEGTPKISISGAVLNDFEGSFRVDDSFDKLFEISGGFAPDADTTTFFIYREAEGTVEKLTFTFDDKVTLQPNDRVIVPHAEALDNIGSVSIEGQVSIPGIYSVKEGQTTLHDLVEMAGGLNAQALPKAGYIYRQSYDNRGVQSVSSISPSLLIRSSDQYLEGFDYMKLEEALNAGRMPVDFSDENRTKQLTLEDGDQVFIPKDENTVSLIGQINSPGFYTFASDYTIADYIDMAEGLTVAADRDRIVVIKAGSRSWLKPSETNLSSGDIIFVDRTPLVDANSARSFEYQQQQLKNNRVQLILAAIGTVTGIITTYVAVTR